jgi:hypothetical protein
MEKPDKRPSTAPGCPSDYQLDAYWLFGESGEAGVAAHLDACGACRARRREMEALDEIFENDVFNPTVDAVVGEVTRHLGARSRDASAPRRRRPLRPIALAAASVLLASALVFVYLERRPQPSEPLAEYIGEKGPVGLEVWCRRADRVFRVHKGDTLYSEDMIRFVPRFFGAAPRYLMVVSLDGAGRVSRYFPPHSDRAERVEKSGIPLPGSTVLDETRGPERVILLTSEKKFHYNEVAEALAKQWRRSKSVLSIQTLGMGMEETSLLFYKGRK